MVVKESSLWEKVKPLLLRVERPSRYIGGEWNAPEIEEGGVGMVIAYPDIYEIGISNLGISILQEVANEVGGASCERAFSPWVDMESEMRAEGIPLFSLETHRPVSGFDIFGISIPHELTFTNILNLIDLAGLPLRSRERECGPLVIGGGCGAANPEPIAEFFDLLFLGESEESLSSLVKLVSRAKREGWSRDELLEGASRIPGAYRPSDYRVEYRDDGTIGAIATLGRTPERVTKAIVDPDEWLYPTKPIVPFCEAIHDRLNIEIFRGCTRGCRFCQAGMIYRPVRERSPSKVLEMARSVSRKTGYEEVSLCSLSSTDYTMIQKLARKLKDAKADNLAISLPSLRMEGFSVDLADEVSRGGRGGLTFAPEAGTDRLRKVMNKPLPEREMVEALVNAVRSGRRRVKLYFMIGLPTETEQDVEQISKLLYRLRDEVRKEGLPPPAFNVSVSTFVPKPHTPFQWVPQERGDSIAAKQEILKETVRGRGLRLSWHDRGMSFVEGLLARGDRRLSGLVELAWERGCRFDSWSEHFDFGIWRESCEELGVDPDFYLYRSRDQDETFPWEHLDFGLDRDFLYREYVRAISEECTPDCRDGRCLECGVCERLDTGLELKGEWR